MGIRILAAATTEGVAEDVCNHGVKAARHIVGWRGISLGGIWSIGCSTCITPSLFKERCYGMLQWRGLFG